MQWLFIKENQWLHFLFLFPLINKTKYSNVCFSMSNTYKMCSITIVGLNINQWKIKINVLSYQFIHYLQKTFPAINHLKSTSLVHYYYQLFICKHLLSFWYRRFFKIFPLNNHHFLYGMKMLCVYQWQKTKRDMIYFFLFVAGFHRSIYLLQKANDLLRGVKGLQRGLIYLKRDKNLEKYTFL